MCKGIDEKVSLVYGEINRRLWLECKEVMGEVFWGKEKEGVKVFYVIYEV